MQKIAKIYLGITPSLPKRPGDPSVISVSVPQIPGKMPEMPWAVKSVMDVPVLVNKLPITKLQGVENDSIAPRQKFVRDTEVNAARASETKQLKGIRTDSALKNAPKQEDYREKAVQILNSQDDAAIDEEPLIEMSEEPIE